jgi:type I restriction enzyme, S subunit
MSEWRIATLGEVCSKPQYGAIAKGTTEPIGPRFVRQTDIVSGRVDWGSVPFCDLPDSEVGKYAIAPGDLLISRLGAGVGTAATVRESTNAVFAGYLVRFRVIPATADPAFIGYQLHSVSWLEHVNGVRSGAAQPTLNAQQMSSFKLSLPPIVEQRRIAGVLGALDDLIETNRRSIANLRSLALAAFDAASAGGELALFGGIATQIREGVAAVEIERSTPYLGLEHFGTDGEGITGVGDAAAVASSKSRFHSGDVLYGKLRPYFRKVDRPGFDGVCSTEIWVLRPQSGWGAATLHAVVARPEFTDFAMSGNKGTKMPRADWAHVQTMPVKVPPEHKRDAIEDGLERLWQATVALQEEVSQLTHTRDELLPLLMSGKVRVAEKP